MHLLHDQKNPPVFPEPLICVCHVCLVWPPALEEVIGDDIIASCFQWYFQRVDSVKWHSGGQMLRNAGVDKIEMTVILNAVADPARDRGGGGPPALLFPCHHAPHRSTPPPLQAPFRSSTMTGAGRKAKTAHISSKSPPGVLCLGFCLPHPRNIMVDPQLLKWSGTFTM